MICRKFSSEIYRLFFLFYDRQLSVVQLLNSNVWKRNMEQDTFQFICLLAMRLNKKIKSHKPKQTRINWASITPSNSINNQVDANALRLSPKLQSLFELSLLVHRDTASFSYQSQSQQNIFKAVLSGFQLSSYNL